MRLLADNSSFVSKPARRARRTGTLPGPGLHATAARAQALTDQLARLTEEVVIVVLNDPATHAAPASSVSVHGQEPKLAKLYQFLRSLPDSVPGAAPTGVQDMVDQAPLPRANPVRERLQQRAVQQVLNGTTWLSSKEVGEQADPAAKNKHALASRLLAQRRVFAINRRGQYEFPRYQFDPLGQPVDAVAEVLAVFDGYTPFRIASWFESASSALGGRRPREVLADDPKAVVEAARDHVRGAVHG
jgi:hypothetical protein